jgi:hypothetical protein
VVTHQHPATGKLPGRITSIDPNPQMFPPIATYKAQFLLSCLEKSDFTQPQDLLCLSQLSQPDKMPQKCFILGGVFRDAIKIAE